jgi:hypothetical protein
MDLETTKSTRLRISADSKQHTSGNKKAEEDAQKATDKQLEDIKQIGEKTGPQVWTICSHTQANTRLTSNRL